MVIKDRKPKKFRRVRRLRPKAKDEADEFAPTPEELAAQAEQRERHEMLSHLVLVGGVWRYQPMQRKRRE